MASIFWLGMEGGWSVVVWMKFCNFFSFFQRKNARLWNFRVHTWSDRDFFLWLEWMVELKMWQYWCQLSFIISRLSKKIFSSRCFEIFLKNGILLHSEKNSARIYWFSGQDFLGQDGQMVSLEKGQIQKIEAKSQKGQADSSSLCNRIFYWTVVFCEADDKLASFLSGWW